MAHNNRVQGKVEDNIPIVRRMLDLDSTNVRSLHTKAFLELGLKNYQESEKYFRRVHSMELQKHQLGSYHNKHMYVYVLLKNGKKEEALTELNELKIFFEKAIDHETDWAEQSGYEMAKIYSLLNDKEEALKWFKRFLENGFLIGLHDYAEYDPCFDNIRNEPEFKEIVRQGKEQIEEKRIKIRKLEKEGLL